MEKEGIIGRIKVLMSEGADNANSFSKKVGIDPSGFRKKMKGESPVMPRDVKLICDALGVNREWLETGEGAKPFYDVDFALGFSEMYNDSPNVPMKHISVPGYEKTDFWCRTSGDSMKPLISNGDITALKQILDWNEFLPLNEVYAIMTTKKLSAYLDSLDQCALLSANS